MRKIIPLVGLLLLSILLSAQTEPSIDTDNVFVMPIRKVKSGQDIADFKTKRDAYIALLEKEEGTLTDREFQPFFEFTNSGLPVDSVFVGLTSFSDFTTFQQIGTATSGDIADDFFATFDFITFQVLQPLDPTELVNLNDFANLGTGQVWETAVRDLSQYENFDQTDYETKRDAYLAVLAAQNNFVREIQWTSISDPNIVVGMTIYKDAQSYAAVNANQDFIDAYLATGFLQSYPINVYGAIHNPLKGTLDSSCEDIGEVAFPEDVTTYEGFLYTSNYFNGAITKKDLLTGEITEFSPPATDIYNSAWGLRVDKNRNQLLSIANQFYDFNPANASAGKVNAYDLATGDLVNTWDLPSKCVGNAIDIDKNGNYYIGDIGPDTRIIKIDPIDNIVTTWADDAQWTDGGFGTGGMVFNQEDGFYVAHAGALWYVPLEADGTAGMAVNVNLTGTTAIDGSTTINADGMAWAGANTIFYAENDVFVPGYQGIVHRITLSDAINGTNSNYLTGINDCSGVFFEDNTLYVNESQFGVAFGVNFVPTSNPFCVKTYSVTDVVADGPVFVMPVRRVKTGQDIEDFKAKRDAYVALLEAEEGTLTDREFNPFFEFTNSDLPVDSIFVGLTSFKDLPTFQQIGEATSGDIANDFFATFDFITFQVLQPLDEDEIVDLNNFANKEKGEVWEAAVRDLSQYDKFDQSDYEEKRDAYLAVLAAQDNFVREVQWRSISDPNVVVGMTVYKDAASYQAVNSDPDFINAYLATGFLQNYPINVYGAIHNILKDGFSTATEEILKDDTNIKLYPNPTTHQLTIESTAKAIRKIEIFSVKGQLLLSQKINGQMNQLDISTLPTAMYIIRIEMDDNKVGYKKLFVQEAP